MIGGPAWAERVSARVSLSTLPSCGSCPCVRFDRSDLRRDVAQSGRASLRRAAPMISAEEAEKLLSGSPLQKKPSFNADGVSDFDTVIEDYSADGPHAPIAFHTSASNKANANFFWTSFNLANDILASSVISQPYFFAQLGFWISPFVYVFFAFVTAYTLNMLYYLCATHSCENYPSLCEKALGKPGLFIACFYIFIFNWGGLVASVLIIGTAVPAIISFFFHTTSVLASREYVLMWCALLFLPLSFFKNISSYAINSFLSFLGLVSVTILVVCRSIATHATTHTAIDPSRLSILGLDPLPALGGLSYMFVCHDLSINVHKEFKGATPRRWSMVVWTVLCTVMFVWFLMAYAGYFMFYDGVQDNILNQFPDDDILAVCARALLCLTIIISIPYSIFMPRVSLYAMCRLVFRSRLDPDIFHILATTILVLRALTCSSCFILALFVTNLGLLFELIGSVSAVGLAYILPPLCFIRLEGGHIYSPKKLINLAVLCFGLFCMVGGAGKIVLGLF